MTTTTLELDAISQPVRVPSRSAAALRSLMQAWEEEGVGDESESETELMVLLSGMVSPEVRTLGDV
jgi:hypothetical protein